MSFLDEGTFVGKNAVADALKDPEFKALKGDEKAKAIATLKQGGSITTEKEDNEFSSEYDDNPKLKGGQKKLPDALQKAIISKLKEMVKNPGYGKDPETGKFIPMSFDDAWQNMVDKIKQDLEDENNLDERSGSKLADALFGKSYDRPFSNLIDDLEQVLKKDDNTSDSESDKLISKIADIEKGNMSEKEFNSIIRKLKKAGMGDKELRELEKRYKAARKAKQDKAKQNKEKKKKAVKEDKTIELPADTTFTLDLKHLMKKHMDEGKSQEDVIKFTKALMKKLHDKGEVKVDGTKVTFVKEGKKKSGYMGYTELAEADEALIQKIVKSLENPNIGTIQDLERRLNNSKKKKEEFEDARDSKGISNYRYYEKIIPKYEELIDFAKHTVKMIKGGADARHHVEELSDKAEKIFPPREYQFGSPLVPVWLDFAKFDKSRERLQTRASDGRIRDLERERNREAGKLGENDTQLALPEPDAQDFLGDDGMDYEGGMAKSQMLKMKKYAMALCDMIDDESQLESWVQAKLTKASDYMSAVYHYLDYQKSKMNEAVGDVIPNGEWQKLDIEWIMDEPDVNRPDYQEGPLFGTTEDGRAFESYGYYTPFEDEYRPLRGEEVVEVPLP